MPKLWSIHFEQLEEWRIKDSKDCVQEPVHIELQHLCQRQIRKVIFAALKTFNFLYLRNSHVHLPGIHG